MLYACLWNGGGGGEVKQVKRTNQGKVATHLPNIQSGMSPSPMHKLELDVEKHLFETRVPSFEDKNQAHQDDEKKEEVSTVQESSPPKSPKHHPPHHHATNSLLLSSPTTTDSSGWSPTPRSPFSDCFDSPGDNSLLSAGEADSSHQTKKKYVDDDVDKKNNNKNSNSDAIPSVPILAPELDSEAESGASSVEQEQQQQQQRHNNSKDSLSSAAAAAPNHYVQTTTAAATATPPAPSTTASSWMCIFDLDAITNQACCGAGTSLMMLNHENDDGDDDDSSPLAEEKSPASSLSSWQMPAFPTKVVEYFHPANSWRGHLPLADNDGNQEAESSKSSTTRRRRLTRRSRSPSSSSTSSSSSSTSASSSSTELPYLSPSSRKPRLSHNSSTTTGLFHSHATEDNIEIIAWVCSSVSVFVSFLSFVRSLFCSFVATKT